MAEITSIEKNRSENRSARFTKKTTRVDLTAMVDLGFLLITFFIFTTAISHPTAMKLALPKETNEINQMPVKRSGALTILPQGDNLISYYEGAQPASTAGLHQCGLSHIREVILQKKRSVLQNDLYIIIKPSKYSTYKNLVDILDEMTINDIKRFALVDITSSEEELISRGQ